MNNDNSWKFNILYDHNYQETVNFINSSFLQHSTSKIK